MEKEYNLYVNNMLMVTNVVIDTNAVLLPFRFNINLEQELTRLFGAVHIVVPSAVLNELKKIEITENERRVALRLCSMYEIVESAERGDRSIVEVAEKVKGIIFTNDAGLKKIAIGKGIGVVSLRGKNHLEIFGSVKMEW